MSPLPFIIIDNRVDCMGEGPRFYQCFEFFFLLRMKQCSLSGLNKFEGKSSLEVLMLSFHITVLICTFKAVPTL